MTILRHYLPNFVSDTSSTWVTCYFNFLVIHCFNALGACIIVHNIVLCIVYNIRHTRVHYRYPQSVNQLCKYIVKCVQVVVFLAIKFWCS